MGLLRARCQIKSLLSDRIGSIVVLEVERLLLFLFFLFYYSWWLFCEIQRHYSSFSSYRWAASLCASLTIFICPSVSIVFCPLPVLLFKMRLHLWICVCFITNRDQQHDESSLQISLSFSVMFLLVFEWHNALVVMIFPLWQRWLMQCVVISAMSWHRSSTVIILYKRSSSGDCFKFMKIILILFKNWSWSFSVLVIFQGFDITRA